MFDIHVTEVCFLSSALQEKVSVLEVIFSITLSSSFCVAKTKSDPAAHSVRRTVCVAWRFRPFTVIILLSQNDCGNDLLMFSC